MKGVSKPDIPDSENQHSLFPRGSITDGRSRSGPPVIFHNLPDAPGQIFNSEFSPVRLHRSVQSARKIVRCKLWTLGADLCGSIPLHLPQTAFIMANSILQKSPKAVAIRRF